MNGTVHPAGASPRPTPNPYRMHVLAQYPPPSQKGEDLRKSSPRIFCIRACFRLPPDAPGAAASCVPRRVHGSVCTPRPRRRDGSGPCCRGPDAGECAAKRGIAALKMHQGPSCALPGLLQPLAGPDFQQQAQQGSQQGSQQRPQHGSQQRSQQGSQQGSQQKLGQG